MHLTEKDCGRIKMTLTTEWLKGATMDRRTCSFKRGLIHGQQIAGGPTTDPGRTSTNTKGFNIRAAVNILDQTALIRGAGTNSG